MLASRRRTQNVKPCQGAAARFTLTISSFQKLRGPRKITRRTAASATIAASRNRSCLSGALEPIRMRWKFVGGIIAGGCGGAVGQKERSTDLAVLCSQACTLPQVLRQTYNSRLQRGAGCGRGARTVSANHARLVREQSADAALIMHLRACGNGVTHRRSSGDL